MHLAVTCREATAADLPAIEAILIAAELSLDGVQAHFADFVLAVQGDDVLGVAGLERYGPHGLLRSVAVRTDHQGRGLGQALTRAMIERATAAGLATLTLLTTTAATFFPKLGFRPVTRDALPAALQASSQLQGSLSYVGHRDAPTPAAWVSRVTGQVDRLGIRVGRDVAIVVRQLVRRLGADASFH